ncbi:MAG: hypothetical protein PVJ34_18715 [Anaerolineae bacterium]
MPVTRWVAALVIPFLILAFLILVFLPDETGTRFAWPIKPPMTAALMGTGYLGGAYFFARVLTAKQWHRVTNGFLPVTAFTWSMLLVTILHWDRFSHGRLGFQLWLVLYIVTPFLVPWLWLRNRATDPQTPEPGELLVPASIRRLTAGIGLLFTALAVVSMVLPSLTIRIWPWSLTPLTARVLGGWMALMGVGCLAIARDPRWSAWKFQVESITLWQALLLVAAVARGADFSSLLNWYLLATIVGVSSTLAIYAGLEMQRRRRVPGRV